MTSRLLLVSLLLLVALPASSAPPQPTDRIPYQGVLLDGTGTPHTGVVDLTARIFDSANSGVLIYSESFTSVPLTDGVFTIQIGPSGSPTDPLATPLTTSLSQAVTGDLAATGPARYLEIQVGAAPPLTRNLILPVPYALHSDSATHADTADTATVAAQALDAQAIGGLDPIVVQAMFQSWNFDGGPPSTDPSEGTADTDGDGLVNFVDPDNDNDGLSDTQEIAQGSNINLVTPIVQSISPATGGLLLPSDVTVSGANFDPAQTVLFGSASVTPTNVTPTSFQATVDPQAAGPVDVRVTLPNGEKALVPGGFTFAAAAIPFTITASQPFELAATPDRLLVSSGVNYAIDTSGSEQFDVTGSAAYSGTAFVTADPLGRPAAVVSQALILRRIVFMRDLDGSLTFDSSEYVTLEMPSTNSFEIRSPGIAFGPSGDGAAGFLRIVNGVTDAVIAHDRDGNGTFDGTNEYVVVEGIGGSTTNRGAITVDPSDRVAYVYWDASDGRIRLAWDLNGDGTYGSPGELTTLKTESSLTCLDAVTDGAGHLAVLYGAAAGPVLLHDLNGDGDFADAGESLTVGAPGATACALADAGTGLAVAHDDGGIHLLVDGNGDGDFADSGEDYLLAASGSGPLAVARTTSGTLWVATPSGLLDLLTP